MITARDVRVDRGSTVALESVSFRAGAGVTVVLGPNGAGKTTLVEAILGRLPCRSGQLLVLGRTPSAHDPEALRKIGWLPQQPDLAGSLRALELATYAAWLKGLSWPEAEDGARDALALVDLTDRANVRASRLSGGQQRRLAFASAIAHRPQVLVLDEPMNGLDPEQRRHLRDVIRRYAATACVVVATHILQDLPDIGGQVLILDRGTTVFADSVDRFIAEAGATTVGQLEDAYVRQLDRDGSR